MCFLNSTVCRFIKTVRCTTSETPPESGCVVGCEVTLRHDVDQRLQKMGKNAGVVKSICYMHLQVFVNMFLISFHFDILTPHKTSFIFLHFNSPTMEPCHTSSHLGSGVGLFIEIFNLKRSCFPCWINEDSSFPNSLWAGEKGEKLFLYRSVPMAAAADPTHQRITWT